MTKTKNVPMKLKLKLNTKVIATVCCAILLMPIASAWIHNHPRAARVACSLSVSPVHRSSSSCASASSSSSSEYSDYGQQDVYWNDMNAFPPNIIDPQAMPSINDMRNNYNNNGNRNNDNRIYETDKYYHQNSGTSASPRFEDIPFRSNENYAKKIYRNPERERQEYGNRGMMGYGGGGMYGGYGGEGMMYGGGMMPPPPPGVRENEVFPPPEGMMGSMQDPYSQGPGGYGGGQYVELPYGGTGGGLGMMMGPGMMVNGMMGVGDWGFQEMGMIGPGGEYGYCGGPGGQQLHWGMDPIQMQGGHPFGGGAGGGPGFW